MAYSSHSEVAEDTTALAAHYTPVLDLGVACVAVHLRELELSLRADSLRKGGIADQVSQSLSVSSSVVARWEHQVQRRMPFWLILRVHLPLGVVADIANLGETSNVQLGRAELRHAGGRRNGLNVCARARRWTTALFNPGVLPPARRSPPISAIQPLTSLHYILQRRRTVQAHSTIHA